MHHFTIHHTSGRARRGTVHTLHGDIQTPAFITVGTKATVKALTVPQLKALGTQTVLANTYHLFLEPGMEVIRAAGGFPAFMGWDGPTMTDSGGFQIFSLGAAYGTGVTKIATGTTEIPTVTPLAVIDEDGVTFKSHKDGSMHRLTPERSMEVQWDLAADIIFAFDECTSPHASYTYQKEAMERTHRWAERSLARHEALDVAGTQFLYGVVQGGRFEELRGISAMTLAELPFDGFGIGGSFTKEDMYTVVGWVSDRLPKEKPRHLLGIGEIEDIFGGVANGADLFDCVAPTRMARNGTLHTKEGKINLFNTRFRMDMEPVEKDCGCFTCTHYTRAYLAHLFHAREMLAGTLATIHNLFFMETLVKNIRDALEAGTFNEYTHDFLSRYRK